MASRPKGSSSKKNGVADSGQTTSVAPRDAASRVRARYRRRISAARAGSHFSSCGTLPWTRPTRDGRPLTGERPVVHPGLPPEGARRHDHHRARHQRRPRSAARQDGPGDQAVHQRDEQRQPVDADETGYLRDWHHARLARAERHPGESAEREPAAVLGGDPDTRRQRQRQAADGRQRAAHDHGHQRRVQRKIGDEYGVDDPGDHRVEPAVRADDGADPVERAGEEHGAGDEPEQERTARTVAPPALMGPREGDQQRNQGDPGDSRVAVLREASGEEEARQDG